MKRVVILCGMVAVLLTACGGSGSSGTTSTTAAGQAATGAGFQDYQNCLKDHGVTLNLPNRGDGGAPPQGGSPPDGNPPQGFDPNNGGGRGPGLTKPDDVDQATWDAAQKACESKRPTFGGNGQGGPQGSTEFQAYQSCMKDHGVDTSNMASVDRTSDSFKSAQTACADLLPQRTTTTAAQS